MVKTQTWVCLIVAGVISILIGCGLSVWIFIASFSKVNMGANVWSPDGRSLVFAWSDHLYGLEIGTKALTQLTNKSELYREANWSPIDDRLIYMVRRSGDFILCETDLGTRKETCMNKPANSDVFFPHWSPDGKRLGIYEGGRYQGSSNEYGYGGLVVSTSGSKTYLQSSIVKLGNISMTDDLQWSPDSNQIAFVGFSTSLPKNIYIIDTSGTKLKRFSDGQYDTSPTWSPDGDQIAFYSERDTQQNWLGAIYVQNVGSKNAKRLSETIDRVNRMQWSPDGQLIAFSTSKSEDSASKVFLMKPDGSNIKLIADNGDVGSLLSWSPDSRFLAFQAAPSLAIVDVNADWVQFYYPQRFVNFVPLELASKLALGAFIVVPLALLALAAVLKLKRR